jgi:hypothetical protein
MSSKAVLPASMVPNWNRERNFKKIELGTFSIGLEVRG